MKKPNFFALLGAVAVVFPTVFSAGAIAQNAPNDEYLNNLYSFLQSQDEMTYAMATSAMTPEQSVWAAQMFCQTFSSGVSPSDAFAVYTSAAVQQAEAQGVGLTDEMAYAVGLYGGAVMNIGSAYYCPEYQSQVQQALQAL